MSSVNFYRKPHIVLCGTVDNTMLDQFRNQLDSALKDNTPIRLELTTAGGDSAAGEQLASDIKMCLANRRDFHFLGKKQICAEGVTIMSAFPCTNRFITQGTILCMQRWAKQLAVARNLTADEIFEKAIDHWRIRADEALKLGLVADVI